MSSLARSEVASPEVNPSIPPDSGRIGFDSGTIESSPMFSHVRSLAPSAEAVSRTAAAPVWLLAASLGGLLSLTLLTYGASKVDLGASGNLGVSLAIAVAKAALIGLCFMHLAWDKKFHWVFLALGVFLVGLFVSASVNDRVEYQPDLDHFEATPAQPQMLPLQPAAVNTPGG